MFPVSKKMFPNYGRKVFKRRGNFGRDSRCSATDTPSVCYDACWPFGLYKPGSRLVAVTCLIIFSFCPIVAEGSSSAIRGRPSVSSGSRCTGHFSLGWHPKQFCFISDCYYTGTPVPPHVLVGLHLWLNFFCQLRGLSVDTVRHRASLGIPGLFMMFLLGLNCHLFGPSRLSATLPANFAWFSLFFNLLSTIKNGGKFVFYIYSSELIICHKNMFGRL